MSQPFPRIWIQLWTVTTVEDHCLGREKRGPPINEKSERHPNITDDNEIKVTLRELWTNLRAIDGYIFQRAVESETTPMNGARQPLGAVRIHEFMLGIVDDVGAEELSQPVKK